MPAIGQKTVAGSLGGLLFLSLLFFLNFTSRVIFSPLLPTIEEEMGIVHAQSGSLFLFISIGYFVSILSSGFVSGRFGHKRTIVGSTVLLGIILFFIQFCQSLFALRSMLFILGMGAGLYFPSGIATIVRIVDPPHWARGLAVHELAPNMAFAAAPLISDLLLYSFSWQGGLAFFGVLLMTSGVFYGLSSQGSHSVGKAPDFQSSSVLFKMASFWGMLLLFSLAICSTIGVYSMTPLFLVTERGMTVENANVFLSFSRLFSICMPLLGGWFGDRFGNHRVMSVVLLLAGIFTIFMAIPMGNGVLLPCIVLQCMIAVCFFPSGFAVLSALAPKEFGNLPVTLCLPMAFLFGAGIMPAMIGFIGDRYSISSAFILVGIFMAVTGGIAFFATCRKK